MDAFHPVNVGKIMVGNFDFVPCTPAGVMELLDEYKIDPKGKECVVVGRSNIVGKPMSMLLLHRHGTVTICHSRTQDLAEVCRRGYSGSRCRQGRLYYAGYGQEGAQW